MTQKPFFNPGHDFLQKLLPFFFADIRIDLLNTVVFHLYAVQLYAGFKKNCEKLSSENFPIICRIFDKIFIITEKLLSSY